MIAQRDRGFLHNAGHVLFGPDGYLYVSLGDEAGGSAGNSDKYNNSQRIDDYFFSGIIRIDVDNQPASEPPNPHVFSIRENPAYP